MMTLSEADLEYVRRIVYDGSSIVLEPAKRYLVDARLGQVARDVGLDTIAEVVAHLRTTRTEALHNRVIEAMTTNETSFFRDVHPFEALRSEVLPRLLESRKASRTLNIWSAACSTGQEAYTIGMVLHEHFPECASWNVRILCTDLSSEVLVRAKEGRFSKLEVNRGVPAAMLARYFTRDGDHYRVGDRLRALVDFRQMNLARPWSGIPAMDVVFLRNVLIYFDVATKKRILAQARSVLRPDALMFLGGAETTLHLDEAFQRVSIGKAICYAVKT
jgi:chemotaxis protein methyltransferase CheR